MVERGLSASECPVCYDGLGPKRVPYSLTCGHTVCWDCIKRLSEGQTTFPCPLCREDTPINGVKRNVTLLQLISQLNEGTASSFSRALTTPFDTIELGRLLDRGASGEVYRGVWQSNDVAIKVFISGQLSANAHESFRREVCIMNTLRHPNVVILLAASPSPPKLAIVMEYVGGGSLYYHLHVHKTPLPVDVIATLLADITRGLQYLHSINILHRDLKSKNVLLTAPPPLCHAKLCDFGLARMRLESATMTGNIGTVHWTAPEVLNCGRYHFSADIYSFGMVIYEIISKSIPFSNLPPPAVIVAVLIRRDKPVPPSDTHPTFLTLFDQCTSWEPSKRPSILSILRDLMLLTPPSLLSESKEDSNDGFDYTDTLGHVEIDFELGNDEDEELMKFLQAQLEYVEEEKEEEEKEEEEKEEEKEKEEVNEVLPVTHEIPAQQANQNVYEDTRGVLSQQELNDYYNMPESNHSSSSSSSSSSLDHHHHQSSSWRRRSYNVPQLVPANSLRVSNEHEPRPHSYSAPIEDKATPTPPPTASIRKEAEDLLYDRDRELALKMQMEERKNFLKKDYLFASEMQKQEVTVGFRGLPPPPPPPPPPNFYKKLPLKDKQRFVLSEVRRSGNRKKNLKHIEPHEKRAFAVGRVIEDTTVDTTGPVFTLQREIASFSKSWFNRVSMKEPKSFFKLGKVVNNRGRVHRQVQRLNSKVQTQIVKFSKDGMRHVSIEERIMLPTIEDIIAEKKPPPSPPPSPPPPIAPPTVDVPMKVKSRVLFKKKVAVSNNDISRTTRSTRREPRVSKLQEKTVSKQEEPPLVAKKKALSIETTTKKSKKVSKFASHKERSSSDTEDEEEPPLVAKKKVLETTTKKSKVYISPSSKGGKSSIMEEEEVLAPVHDLKGKKGPPVETKGKKTHTPKLKIKKKI